MQGLSKSHIAAAVLLIFAAAGMALLHSLATSFSCAWDTSNCAHSSEKDGVYEGTLRTLDGDPYRSSEFDVGFGSRPIGDKITFRTDARGRFCIVWSAERVVPSATTPSGYPLVGRDGENIPGLGGFRDLEGRDPPPDCQESDEGIPWNRSDDADSTWQYWLLLLLPLAAIAFLVAAVAMRGSFYASRLLVLGASLLAANLVAGAILWGAI